MNSGQDLSVVVRDIVDSEKVGEGVLQPHHSVTVDIYGESTLNDILGLNSTLAPPSTPDVTSALPDMLNHATKNLFVPGFITDLSE